MADSIQASTDPPPAHVGAHYDNASSKPLRGPVGPLDRDGVQRWVWPLLLVLVIVIVAMGAVLSIIRQAP